MDCLPNQEGERIFVSVSGEAVYDFGRRPATVSLAKTYAITYVRAGDNFL